MKQEKRAWVYCRIDAPEDTHGALKNQRKLLMDYAEQMGFVVAGCSEDFGSGADFERPGWKRAAKAVQAGIPAGLWSIWRNSVRVGLMYILRWRES